VAGLLLAGILVLPLWLACIRRAKSIPAATTTTSATTP
jgi:hypothetical protein